MRKKIIALFSFFILIFSISFSAYAASPTQQIEYLSDGSYIAVSYTHLDVYKRQVHMIHGSTLMFYLI